MRERLIGTEYRSILKRLLLVAVCVSLPVIAWAQWTTSSNNIYNSNSGNVGLGTSSPSARLTIKQLNDSQSGGNAGLRVENTAGTGITQLLTGGDNASYLFNGTGSSYLMLNSSGNVGIGTMGPTRQLHVFGVGQAASNGLTDAGNKNGTLYVQDSGGAPYNGGAIILGAGQGYFAGIKSLITDGTANTIGDLDFQTRNGISDTALTSRLYINHLGNIGIGTISPTSKLDINGDVTVSGNISAKYQDLAEWVLTVRDLRAGTVVALDTEVDNVIVPSFAPYDTHVAGVVSKSPGIVLGQGGPGKVRIATTGRVKVHVDTSNGPIRRGDLLVTGTREGTAMRSEPVSVGGAEFHRPGTLIGKALEPLNEGEGEILVLLSLQ